MTDRQTLKSALTRTSECLTPEELERYVEAEHLDNAHLANCLYCQSELTLLCSFQSDEPLEGEGAAVSWISTQLENRLPQIKGARPSARSQAQGASLLSWFGDLFSGKGLRILVPTAAVLMLALAGTFFLQGKKQPQLSARLGGQEDIYRSGSIAIVAPTGELTTPPASLEWNAYPGAAKYDAVIMEVDRTPLWSTQTNASKATIPGGVRGKLLPGKTVLWQVKALDAQGKVLATSQSERIVVTLKHTQANH
jgi:hypothetical protein